MNLRISFLLLLFCVGAVSCKKFIAVDPPVNQVTSQTVFTSDATAIATVNGIYSQMMNNPNQFTSSLTTLYAGLYADDLYNYSTGPLDEFTASKLSLTNHSVLQSGFWQPAYNSIYTSNRVLEGLQTASSLTPPVKKQVEGEARFVRAFCYFYLVNFFGEVPLITQTDYLVNRALPRASETDIYQQIVVDLKVAQQTLPASYPLGEKNKPTKWAATTLLARTYLYQKNWQQAQTEASSVIDAGSFSLAGNLRTVFLKNSAEAIWQLQPVNPTYNTHEARAILPGTPAALPTYVLTSSLVNAFESGDQRKTSWDTVRVYNNTTYHIPYKYKVATVNAPLTEYYTVLRLAELYLIRAEANAWLNHVPEALQDLNRIRTRAGLPALSLPSSTDLLAAIAQERRVELFSEWGHRWLDLKRTGRADAVLSSIKPAWTPTAVLWPVPQGEINLNPSLVQNPGY